MATVLTGKDIAARALEVIGATSLSDSGPSGVHQARALAHLGMILDSFAGSIDVRWWQPEPATIPFVLNQTKYSTSSLASGAGVIVVLGLQLIDSSSDLRSIELLGKGEFEKLDPGAAASTPTAACVYQVDGQTVIKVHPKPNAAAVSSYSLYVSYQRGASVVTTGDANLKLAQALNMFLVWQLAYNLGTGVIRKLPDNDLRRLEKDANKERVNVLHYIGRPRTATRGFTANRDF